jgi:small-conductance mechanosensitive channel
MLQAAAATADVDQKKQSFILQQSLDDFSVSYELNVYTHNPEKMPWIKSQLNANLQQAFTEAQIEILSPIYHAQRDGNPLTIPSVTSEQGQL